MALPSPFQSFIDSDVGLVVATTLHTAGAILFLGGLASYLVWHRHLVHGQHQVRVLSGAAALTYLAIAANLAGGFMRTYETGHPGLFSLDSSPWVRVLALKHLFLFAGMGAAVWLFESVAPRLVRAHRDGNLASVSQRGHQVASLLTGSSILTAALLGGLMAVVPLHETEPAEDGGTVTEEHEDAIHDGHAVAYHNATGQLTSTPVAPAAGTSTFEVPEGTANLQATLAWSPAQFALRLTLTDPTGTVTLAVDGDAGRAEGILEAPVPGAWTATVESDAAVGVAWSLSVRMTPGAEGEAFLAETVVIPGGSFFEINTEMELNATLNWDWSTEEGTPVHFDVHSHFDDEVQYWVEMETAEHAGSFTNERTGGYSYLWENGGATPVRLTYRAWGGFVVDSYFPPR